MNFPVSLLFIARLCPLCVLQWNSDYPVFKGTDYPVFKGTEMFDRINRAVELGELGIFLQINKFGA